MILYGSTMSPFVRKVVAAAGDVAQIGERHGEREQALLDKTAA